MSEAASFSLEAIPVSRDINRSLAIVVLGGLNARTINHGSQTTYEVVAGSGVMEIDGVFHDLERGTKLTVPRGTPYQDESTSSHLILLATSEPPFDPAQITYV